MVVVFQGQSLNLIMTDHARERAALRKIRDHDIREVVESGTVRAKKTPGKFWVFKALTDREDNLVCLSVSREMPNLVVISALINWSPDADQI